MLVSGIRPQLVQVSKVKTIPSLGKEALKAVEFDGTAVWLCTSGNRSVTAAKRHIRLGMLFDLANGYRTSFKTFR